MDGVNVTEMLKDMQKVIYQLKDSNYSDEVEAYFSQGITAEAAGKADDAVWIIVATYIIFTMQSGFGLLESGSVSTKNEVNIMVKNTIDILFGGFTFWLFGYSFAFGDQEPQTNFFSGYGNFLAFADFETQGDVYAKFFFQASFATTATTIVSGAMAERTRLSAYIIFSLLNTLVYVFPAHWAWGSKGWLVDLGFIDIAGCGPIHVVGGIAGLVATIILKPRHKRFDKGTPAPMMGSATNVILGTFMLWWGWFGFNCGSTYGISGGKSTLAVRSAVSTLNASIAGGMVGCFVSYMFKKRIFDVGYLVNSILGGLVGITSHCALADPWEGFVIGAIGALFALGGSELMEKLKIDDPVSCIGVHAFAGVWGLLSVGFFKKADPLAAEIDIDPEIQGVFYGGDGYLLGVQVAAAAAIIAWTAITSAIMLLLIDVFCPLRMPLHEELLGADVVEHGLGDEEMLRLAFSDKSDPTPRSRRPSVSGGTGAFGSRHPQSRNRTESEQLRYALEHREEPKGLLSRLGCCSDDHVTIETDDGSSTPPVNNGHSDGEKAGKTNEVFSSL